MNFFDPIVLILSHFPFSSHLNHLMHFAEKTLIIPEITLDSPSIKSEHKQKIYFMLHLASTLNFLPKTLRGDIFLA